MSAMWVRAWVRGAWETDKRHRSKGKQLEKCPFLESEIVLPGTQPGGQNKD